MGVGVAADIVGVAMLEMFVLDVIKIRCRAGGCRCTQLISLKSWAVMVFYVACAMEKLY